MLNGIVKSAFRYATSRITSAACRFINKIDNLPSHSSPLFSGSTAYTEEPDDAETIAGPVVTPVDEVEPLTTVPPPADITTTTMDKVTVGEPNKLRLVPPKRPCRNHHHPKTMVRCTNLVADTTFGVCDECMAPCPKCDARNPSWYKFCNKCRAIISKPARKIELIRQCINRKHPDTGTQCTNKVRVEEYPSGLCEDCAGECENCGREIPVQHRYCPKCI